MTLFPNCPSSAITVVYVYSIELNVKYFKELLFATCTYKISHHGSGAYKTGWPRVWGGGPELFVRARFWCDKPIPAYIKQVASNRSLFILLFYLVYTCGYTCGIVVLVMCECWFGIGVSCSGFSWLVTSASP